MQICILNKPARIVLRLDYGPPSLERILLAHYVLPHNRMFDPPFAAGCNLCPNLIQSNLLVLRLVRELPNDALEFCNLTNSHTLGLAKRFFFYKLEH